MFMFSLAVVMLLLVAAGLFAPELFPKSKMAADIKSVEAGVAKDLHSSPGSAAAPAVAKPAVPVSDPDPKA